MSKIEYFNEDCQKRKRTGNYIKKHGLSKTRISATHSNMMARCYNPKSEKYKRYGGRGIVVCDEWKTPKNFFDWSLSNGYAENLTIERIDNNGNYEPNNCTWITKGEQARNKSTNKNLTLCGVTRCITEWAEVTGYSIRTIQWRIKSGWSTSDLLTIEPSKKNRLEKINGKH